MVHDDGAAHLPLDAANCALARRQRKLLERSEPRRRCSRSRCSAELGIAGVLGDERAILRRCTERAILRPSQQHRRCRHRGGERLGPRRDELQLTAKGDDVDRNGLRRAAPLIGDEPLHIARRAVLAEPQR